MGDQEHVGWRKLVEGHPWFDGEGKYPIPAYSEFMPPPRVGRTAYGGVDPLLFSADDPHGWRVSEIEEEYELRPGLESIGKQVLEQLVKLGRGEPAYHISGHKGRNLEGNRYWPKELADGAKGLEHERYVILMPLALSKTQDDLGRVRWTFFGNSEQGPERAFWKGFETEPGKPMPPKQAESFFRRILSKVYGEKSSEAESLLELGFRILPSLPDDLFPYWVPPALPDWTRPYLVGDSSPLNGVRYLLTFRPFSRLPDSAKEAYLKGKLALLPFPGSLVFWGVPNYLGLQKEFPFAIHFPLLRLVARHGGPGGLRVPQSGWIRETRGGSKEAEIRDELLVPSYSRTSRWDRVHRDEDEVAASARIDHITRVLFSSDLDSIGLYDKPEARNCQLLTEETSLLLDGPAAGRDEIKHAETVVVEGGLFRYRFQFPPMQVGKHQVYWHRPLAAFLSQSTGECELLGEAPLGYLSAYQTDSIDLSSPIELYPRMLRRDLVLAALRQGDQSERDRRRLPLNVLALLDSWQLWGERPLPLTLARQMLRVEKHKSIGDWLESLPAEVRNNAGDLVEAQPSPVPPAITYADTASRTFEEALWNDIRILSDGTYRTKDNADVVQDAMTEQASGHHHRDLEKLGEYLLSRHRAAIADAGMEDKAVCGEVPFRWQTDMEYRGFGGWDGNQDGTEYERDLLVVIPGKNRGEAVVLADHYDTAYEEDVYDKSRGGTGARLAAAGADDNCSASATLLRAAPIFLKLSKEGRLERDVWLLHLTGEEFPADCMGARHFCQALVEKNLELHVGGDTRVNLGKVRVVGVYVMDMIAHNRDGEPDIFQISPGRGAASLRLAWHAHIANLIWNAGAEEWNRQPDRRGQGRGVRRPDGAGIPAIALHPRLDGQVRTVEDPRSSLYNTDGQIFSDAGVPAVLLMENYDINRSGYHDTKDTMGNIDLDYGAALSAMAIEAVARVATATAI